MKKTFELPKEFTEKWVKALESGEYKQTEGTLIYYQTIIEEQEEEDTVLTVENCAYCCLGVAAAVSGATVEDIEGHDLLFNLPKITLKEDIFSKIPKILLKDHKENLVGILVSLNDGYYLDKEVSFKKKFPNLKFLKNVTGNAFGKKKYNFKQIAEFIKLNVEFV